MKASKIEQARKEALKFVDLSTAILKQSDAQDLLFGSKLSGQLRRSSIDLTRALAEMRDVAEHPSGKCPHGYVNWLVCRNNGGGC
jgi:hypothetical protein